MIRFTALAVALLVVAGAGGVRGQDSDEVKRLKERIALLEAKLEAALLKVEKLEKENQELKAGAAKGSAGAKQAAAQPTLSDILTEGTTIRGDFRFINGNMGRGEWTLTIKERMGRKFKGVYTAKGDGKPDTERQEADAEGEISGDYIRFSPVNTTKMMATVTGTRKKEVLELNWAGKAGQAKLIAKLPK